jgi:hypothetical protein
MEIWEAAITVAGLGAIASFVLWSLYSRWLTLPIFQPLAKHQQFALFKLMISLTFLFAPCVIG